MFSVQFSLSHLSKQIWFVLGNNSSIIQQPKKKEKLSLPYANTQTHKHRAKGKKLCFKEFHKIFFPTFLLLLLLISTIFMRISTGKVGMNCKMLDTQKKFTQGKLCTGPMLKRESERKEA